MKKKMILMALSSLLSLSAISQIKKKSGTKKTCEKMNQVLLESQLDSMSYAFGFNISQDLQTRGFTGLNYDLLARAMADSFEGRNAMLTQEQSQTIILSALANAKKQKYAPILVEGEKFLAENKKKAGVITLQSGLQYEELLPSTGEKPKATDEVTVHYRGTLINGKQFDSSYDQSKPRTFVLNGVIPGWAEGLQLMPVGSKYRFVIPHQLAYGENGSGQDIPPYSTLIFDVELIKIGG